MNIGKLALKGSPFIGVFCKITSNVSLVPFGLSPKETHALKDLLGNELIFCSLANSSLLGVLACGNQNGFVVPEMIEKNEINTLKEQGIAIEQLKTVHALGNLVSANDSVGLYSPILSDALANHITRALKIPLTKTRIAESDLVGACLVLNNKGFVCSTRATKTDISTIQKTTRLRGNLSSANFGDPFVGNSVVGNDHGALVGQHSTPHEMLAIEEALSGEA